MFEATINRARRLITFRATGRLTNEEVGQIYEEAKRITDLFRGEPHIVLADMRGMAVLTEDKQKVFADVMKYGRAHGTMCCVHLSDSSIARLQHSRLAREASPYDDITINVVSIEEAERVIQEKQPKAQPKKA